MSLLTIVQDVARNTAIGIPATASGSTEREIVNVVQFVNDTGLELARRVDWGALRATTTVTGNGTNANFILPAYYSRPIKGGAVLVGGVGLRGGLSPDEWAALTPVEGTPRFYRLIGSSISFYPFLANAATATVNYQSTAWASNGTDRLQLDAETSLIPEDLLVKGAIWRQRRHVGQDFSDQVAEYEAALADYADYDARDRSP
jgi:hypothetical protein